MTKTTIINNWKTSLCGVLELLVGIYSLYVVWIIAPQLKPIFLGIAVQQLVSGVAHLLSRDADKSSESSGIK